MSEMQMSMFDFMGEVMDEERRRLREILKRGSGCSGGRLRIYAAERLLDNERFVMFLADEFGTGGHSVKGGFVDYNGRGVTVRDWQTGLEKKYSWKQIAKEYREMILCGEFPEEKVIGLYDEARRDGLGAPRPRMRYLERGDQDD